MSKKSETFKEAEIREDAETFGLKWDCPDIVFPPAYLTDYNDAFALWQKSIGLMFTPWLVPFIWISRLQK